MNLNSHISGGFPAPHLVTVGTGPVSGPAKVLLIGPTGFIGSRILRSLHAHDDIEVSILARRSTGLVSGDSPLTLLGDLTDQDSVRRAVSGAEVVINAAPYVGSDQKRAEEVNRGGTMAIIRACEASAVRRLIQISTTAVYGSGPHRGIRPSEAQYGPESAASRSRAAADQAVLAAGGIVVRPSLVHGVGDRWFIPGTVRMFNALGSTIENGAAKFSMIDVEVLGRLVAALALTASPTAGAFHAADPTPVTLNRLLRTINRHVREIDIAGSSSLDEAVHALKPAGFRPHQIHMLGMDHYYEAQALWSLAALKPKGFRLAPETAAWYRAQTAPKKRSSTPGTA